MRWNLAASLALAALCAALHDVTSFRARQLETQPVMYRFNDTDYATDPAPDSPQYDRCKTTHRCNRAFGLYDVDLGQYLFRTERFSGGRQENADLFLNFEDWRAGTVGLGVDHAYLLGQLNTTKGAHFNAFDEINFPIPVTTANDSFQWHLVYNSSDIAVTFNTSGPLPTLTIFNQSCAELNAAYNATGNDTLCDDSIVVQGFVALTEKGTQTGLFNFHSVYLGPPVNVTVTGNRALVIISKSTAIYDTPIHVQPGTLGAFPKAKGPSVKNNNFWGAGSGATRVYMQTLHTFGDPVFEIQTVTTSADPGQQLGGGFKLTYKGDQTHMLAWDVKPAEMKRALEGTFSLGGLVDVTRTRVDDQGGYTWSITFTTAVGNPDQMTVENHLTGIGHNVVVHTLQDGDVINGTYTIGFMGGRTREIPVNATEEELQDILRTDLAGYGMVSAHVTRTDPTKKCENGLCFNGPQQAWGYSYFLTLSTYQTVVVPTSPTRPSSPRWDETGVVLPATVATIDVQCSAQQATCTVYMQQNIPQTMAPRIPYHPYNVSSPVTLPYGGAGGSNGGAGGFGHATQPPFPSVLDDVVSDIVAGSNGASGGEIPQQTLSLAWDCGSGGSGGGALELIAVNDLIIGPHGGLSADGEDGENAFRAGGGGSGGTILLSAGGVIVIQANVTARGGGGGTAVGLGGRGGGGGGGGRIAGYAQSLNLVGSGRFDVSGGIGGADQAPAPPPPEPYIGQIEVYYPYKSFYNGIPRNSSNMNGVQGVLHVITAGGSRYRIELEDGAEDTRRSLRLTVDETVVTDTGVTKVAPFVDNGPAFTLPAASSGYWLLRRGIVRVPTNNGGGVGDDGTKNTGTNPMRVTVYLKVAPPKHGTVTGHWGAHIALHEEDYRPQVPGQPGSPPEGNGIGGTGGAGSGGPGSSTAFGGVAGDGGEGGGIGGDAVAMIGVAVVDGKLKHQANYRHTPGSDLSPTSPHALAYSHIHSNRWYKVDIFIDWTAYVYKVRIDDVTVVQNVSFVGSVVRRLGLYGFDAGTVWFDEIYAGPDNQMRFECPQTLGDQDLYMQRPLQYNWNANEVGPDSTKFPASFWDSHISMRQKYVHDIAGQGIDLTDSYIHRRFFEDVKTRTADGTHNIVNGAVHAGSLTFVPPSRLDECGGVVNGDLPPEEMIHRAETTINSRGEWGAGVVLEPRPHNHGNSGRYFWYGDHTIDTSILQNSAYAIDRKGASYTPGLPKVQGALCACSTTDFLSWRNEGIMLYYLNITQPNLDPLDYITRANQFYMLAERPKVLYNEPTEKYVMWMYADTYNLNMRLAGVARSCWPNGPFSFQGVFHPDRNETVDLTVFQNSTGTGFLARTYYANTTYYLPAPIMQPIWQSVQAPESTPDNPVIDYSMNYHRSVYDNGYDNIADIYSQRWRMEDKPWNITTGNIRETFNATANEFVLSHLNGTVIASAPPAFRQHMLAQHLDNSTYRNITGQGQPPIESRYRDPELHSTWMPASVPAVKAQPWLYNYADNNIADNPIHQTVADLLIGPERIVEIRRAKYLSISLLTPDYLNSSGVIQILEGEMENEEDLIVLLGSLNEYDKFGWQAVPRAGLPVKLSTYNPDVNGRNKGVIDFQTEFDWETRHWQYYNEFGDRRYDFVNFRDKQTSLECPRLHNVSVAKYQECVDIYNAITIIPGPEELNWENVSYSHFEYRSTEAYENCLAEHVAALQAYEDCVRAQLPDFDAEDPWGVGSRECVGGGGECGPPANGQRPQPQPPLIP